MNASLAHAEAREAARETSPSALDVPQYTQEEVLQTTATFTSAALAAVGLAAALKFDIASFLQDWRPPRVIQELLLVGFVWTLVGQQMPPIKGLTVAGVSVGALFLLNTAWAKS